MCYECYDFEAGYRKEINDGDPRCQRSDSSTMILETFLILVAIPFVGLSLFFGTKNGYYDSDDYTGDGCAHDVKR